MLDRVLVGCDQGDRAREATVGDGDAGVGARRDARGHARHDLEGDPRLGQPLGLLAAASEHERVAALQPHHPLAGLRAFDHQLLGLRLRHRSLAARPAVLPHIAQLRVRTGAVERLGGDETVVEDHVRLGNQLARTHAHQPGVAGARRRPDRPVRSRAGASPASGGSADTDRHLLGRPQHLRGADRAHACGEAIAEHLRRLHVSLERVGDPGRAIG